MFSMKNLAKILLFSLSLLSISLLSCSESEGSVLPIELAYESPDVVFDNENPRMTMMGYETSERVLLIRGGQGEYRVESSNNAVAEARCEGNRLLVRPIGAGKTNVIIRDESGCDYWLSVSVGYPFYKYAVIDNRVSLQGEGLTDDEKKALEKEMLEAQTGPAVLESYAFVYKNEAKSEGTLVLGSSHYSFDASAQVVVPGEPLQVDVRTDDGFARSFFFESFTPVRFSSENGSVSDELFLSERNAGVAPATRDLDQTPYFRCFVFDRTAQYKDRYPALERACYLQVAVEQYVGVTTED